MLAKVHSAQINGIRADIIDVEVDISKGLHSFSIVGLPDKAVEEARDRISAAIKNSGFRSPQKGNHKVIVSLAPADIKKEGAGFDLAIAIANLLATKEIKFAPQQKIFLGELALSGELRPIRGALLLVKKAKEFGFTEVYLPADNAREGALIDGIAVYGCDNLGQLVKHLDRSLNTEQGEKLVKLKPLAAQEKTKITIKRPAHLIDFADVKGQASAKRGLEIAAAGGHNVAMYGPPGTGKTMLAKAFASILPPLSFEEIIETTGIHSASGALAEDLVTHPPFRSPHHTASYVSLVGGGAWPRPGEVTLAHRGVLFLDEFPEFDRNVIEALRQPLEDRIVTISRARGTLTFPAGFLLVAAMNPCPCGNRGLREKECVCSAGALLRYQRKISGPIIDRIDIWLDVPQVDPRKLSAKNQDEEPSVKVKERVKTARQKQAARFSTDGLKIRNNGEMGVKELKKYAPLSDTCTDLLNTSAQKLDLSARAYHRIIKLARTIADLAGVEDIKEEHLLEALRYRPKSLI